MAQPFNNAIITNDGARLITRAQAGEIKIEFTRIAIGNGNYAENEKGIGTLQSQTALRSEQNSYPLSSVDIFSDHSVKITALITNQDPITGRTLIDNGYFINEMGLFAKVKDREADTEVLYSITVTTGINGDFMPPFNGYYPVHIVQEYYATVNNSVEVTIQAGTGGVILTEDYLQLKTNIGNVDISKGDLQTQLNNIKENVIQHTEDKENPHETNKYQVGLGNVDNTSDEDKPVSNPVQAAMDALYRQLTGYTNQKIADLIGGAPSTLDTLEEIANAIRANDSVVDALEDAIGSKAGAAEFDSHEIDSTKHITAAERNKWNAKQDPTGDAKDNTVTFSSSDVENPISWTAMALFKSKEKLSSLLNKVSIMAKNVRYLYKMLGTTDISGMGDGTVTGALSQLNSNIQLIVRSDGDIPCPPNTETVIAKFGPVVPGVYFVDWYIHFNDHGHREGTREAQYGTDEGFFAQTSVPPAPANSSGNGATISEVSGLILTNEQHPYICAYVNHSANITLNVGCFGQLMRVR